MVAQQWGLKTMSNKTRLVLIAALMATSGGCKLFQNMVRTMVLEPIQFTAHIDDKLEFARYRRLATSILDQCEPRRCQNIHFARGFKYGFADYLLAGPRAAPPLPPRRYWDSQYQSPAGHQAALDWFQGYERGVSAACESGHRGHVTVALNPQIVGDDTYVSSRPDYNVGCGISYDHAISDHAVDNHVIEDYVTEPMVNDSVLEEVPEVEEAIEADTTSTKSAKTKAADATVRSDATVPDAKSKPADIPSLPEKPSSSGIKSPSDKALELLEPPLEIRSLLRPDNHVQTGYQPVDTGFETGVKFASSFVSTEAEATHAGYIRHVNPKPESTLVSPAKPRQLTTKQ